MLSSKGQLVIPAWLRQLLMLKADDRLSCSLQSGGLFLIPLKELLISYCLNCRQKDYLVNFESAH